jgi:hypothetical protein
LGLVPRSARPPPHRCAGFSALELVLVILATSIVVALGVSIYRTYVVRAQIGASIDDAVAAQRLVARAFAQNGVPPRDAAGAAIDAAAPGFLAGKYVESLEVSDGRIDLRFGPSAASAIAGKTLSLTPFETAGQEIVWICGNETPDVGLQPLGFAGGAHQAIQLTTSIEDRYLPRSCR